MPAGFFELKPNELQHKRLIIYGAPKSVKTPLALAYGAYLRSVNPDSKTLYIAADKGSETLPSLPNPEWRDWIKVWTMGSLLDPNYDPYKDAIHVAMADWKSVDKNIDLLIWDTFPMTMEEVLQFCADSEFFSGKGGDKHITFGDPRLPKSNAARMNIPLPGDYNGVNGIAKRLVQCLCAQPMHVIIICHEQEIKDEKGIKRIGPSFVGSALTGKLPGWMTGLMYTEKRGEINQQGKIVPALYVCSDPGDDLHLAGIRHEPIKGDPRNPIGVVKVGPDLTAYWKLFHETLFPNEVLTLTPGA